MKNAWIRARLALTALVFFASWDLASSNETARNATTDAANVEIVMEAESGQISGQMRIITDGQAFNNKCVEGFNVNRRGWTTFNVNIPTAGTYVVWGRILGMDQYTNSFFVSVDGGEPFIWDIHKHNQWEWDWISDRGATGEANEIAEVDPVLFNFTAGNHVLKIGNREKHTKLDRIVITNDLAATYADAPQKWIDLVSPIYGDVIIPGSAFEIKWNSANISNKVNIDLSLDRGATFAVPLAQNTDNDGSFIWNVPSYYKIAKLVIRVSDASGAPYDVNWGFFAVVKPALVNITLQKPNGGEQILAGSTYVVTWKEYAFNGIVRLFYSTDNGATWTAFAEHQDAAGSNWWIVPNTPSTHCLVMVADAKDGTRMDVSNAPFTILPSVPVAANGAGATAAQSALDMAAAPAKFDLGQNYPNPFNGATFIEFALPKPEHVTLRIFNVSGQEVRTLLSEQMQAGFHKVKWDGLNASGLRVVSGVYFYRIEAGSFGAVRKMSIIW